MSALQIEIEKHIKKLVYPLQAEEQLRESLKKKLTKKEFKLLKAWSENTSTKEIQTILHVDTKRYDELSTKLIKKLNQEKTKQAIYMQ